VAKVPVDIGIGVHDDDRVHSLAAWTCDTPRSDAAAGGRRRGATSIYAAAQRLGVRRAVSASRSIAAVAQPLQRSQARRERELLVVGGYEKEERSTPAGRGLAARETPTPLAPRSAVRRRGGEQHQSDSRQRERGDVSDHGRWLT